MHIWDWHICRILKWYAEKKDTVQKSKILSLNRWHRNNLLQPKNNISTTTSSVGLVWPLAKGYVAGDKIL